MRRSRAGIAAAGCCQNAGHYRKAVCAIELLVGQPSPFDKLQQFRQLMFFRKSKKNDSFRNRSSCYVIGHFLRKNKRMKCPTRGFPSMAIIPQREKTGNYHISKTFPYFPPIFSNHLCRPQSFFAFFLLRFCHHIKTPKSP